MLELLLEVERHHIDPHVGGRTQRIEAVAVQRAHKLVLAGIAVVEQVEKVLCHASLLWFRFPTGLGARLGVGVWAWSFSLGLGSIAPILALTCGAVFRGMSSGRQKQKACHKSHPNLPPVFHLWYIID